MLSVQSIDRSLWCKIIDLPGQSSTQRVKYKIFDLLCHNRSYYSDLSKAASNYASDVSRLLLLRALTWRITTSWFVALMRHKNSLRRSVKSDVNRMAKVDDSQSYAWCRRTAFWFDDGWSGGGHQVWPRWQLCEKMAPSPRTTSFEMDSQVRLNNDKNQSQQLMLITLDTYPIIQSSLLDNTSLFGLQAER